MTPAYLIKHKRVTQVIRGEEVSQTLPEKEAETLHRKLINKGYKATIEKAHDYFPLHIGSSNE